MEVRRFGSSVHKLKGNAPSPAHLNTERIIHSLGVATFPWKKWLERKPMKSSRAKNTSNRTRIKTV